MLIEILKYFTFYKKASSFVNPEQKMKLVVTVAFFLYQFCEAQLLFGPSRLHQRSFMSDYVKNRRAAVEDQKQQLHERGITWFSDNFD